MPFNKSARLTVSTTRSEENLRRESISLYFYIYYRVYGRPVKDVHYFHSRFREIDPVPRGRSLLLAEMEGDGHFVGLLMGQRARMPGWFGEGDDIITVDGQVSFLGTGTEDYFCDAWGFRVFSDLYLGVPVPKERENGDRLGAYGFHILDPITFRKSFRFELEYWPWVSPWPNTDRNYFSCQSFWYQKSVHKPWPHSEEILSLGPWDPDKGRWHVEGDLEAEDLGILSFESAIGRAARPVVQRYLPNLSGDHMLVFDSGGKGFLSLAVPVEQDGLYETKIHFVRAPDCEVVELEVNGKVAGEPVDTFLKTDDLTRPVWPPRVFVFPGLYLTKGLNMFLFHVNDRNAHSEGFKIGINESEAIWTADGLTASLKKKLIQTLGPTFANRLHSAEPMAVLSGNQLLRNILDKAKREGIPKPKIYSHSIGYYLHEPGPLIGLPWEQEDTGGRVEVRLVPNSTFTAELSVTCPVPELGGQEMTMALEQVVAFTPRVTYFIDGRQTAFHLIN